MHGVCMVYARYAKWYVHANTWHVTYLVVVERCRPLPGGCGCGGHRPHVTVGPSDGGATCLSAAPGARERLGWSTLGCKVDGDRGHAHTAAATVQRIPIYAVVSRDESQHVRRALGDEAEAGQRAVAQGVVRIPPHASAVRSDGGQREGDQAKAPQHVGFARTCVVQSNFLMGG
eukprot:scaffold79873_cov75-Phaeocystis_antarctica.AAC.3